MNSNFQPKDKRISATLMAMGMALTAALVTFAAIGVARSDNPFTEDKQEFLDRLRNPPTPDPSILSSSTVRPNTYPSPDATGQPRPDGLYDYGQAPFPFMLYAFENQWQGHIAGELVIVYAGHLGHGTKRYGQGVISSIPVHPGQ